MIVADAVQEDEEEELVVDDVDSVSDEVALDSEFVGLSVGSSSGSLSLRAST